MRLLHAILRRAAWIWVRVVAWREVTAYALPTLATRIYPPLMGELVRTVVTGLGEKP